MSADKTDYIHRILAVFAFDGTDSIYWRVDGAHAPVTFFVQCSDLFHWGSADLEVITPSDLDALEQAADDVRAYEETSGLWAGDLFAARKRHMRPQGAAYKNLPEPLWPLFNAAGPERELGLSNPKPIPARGRP